MTTPDDPIDDEDRKAVTRRPLDALRDRLTPTCAYRLTRALLLRSLGVVYAAAFLGLIRQGLPLLGSSGLTPIADYLHSMAAIGVGPSTLPTLFFLDASDGTFLTLAWVGLVLSLIVVAGYANAPILFALWVIYGSFVRAGQLWFAFGWEIQLLETGMLATFLAPPLDPRPSHARPPPYVVIVLFRWLVFRLMLGAGLIKLRGDPCWQALTCLDTHFETQPIPNPLSPWFHHLPHAVLAGGVLVNHVVELVAPWFVFGPRRARLVAATLMAAFQIMLIVSGNLSFLNWLTLVAIVACFDDEALGRLVPSKLRARLDHRARLADEQAGTEPSRGQRIASASYATLVAVLSLRVVANLLSPGQAMNRDFDRFSLVNTYGAFGSVGRVRHELVIEGTRDLDPARATWRAYDFPCKPGDVLRRPCVLGPYHLRADWLIWFAAMEPRWDGAPWLLHFTWKLLHGDRGALSLLASNPFPEGPPRFVRIRRYVYRFAPRGSSAWWVRTQEGEWLPPVAIGTPGFGEALKSFGWPSPIDAGRDHRPNERARRR